ncbi:UNVERIFIED_CONTAM: hypothetical protein K2H54_046686 [Gekko kuhli]
MKLECIGFLAKKDLGKLHLIMDKTTEVFVEVLIMLLTDPEIESSLLISSDEGATYQKYRLNFYIHSMLFHPKQEDWILAYSQDQKPCLNGNDFVGTKEQE